MLLKVVVGDKTYQKDCSWDYISSVKADIKTIARWNPSDKAWVVTSTDANEVSKIIADIFGEDYEKILPQIKRAIEAAERAKIEALRKEMLKYLKQGIFAVKAREYLGKEKWKEAMRLFVWNKKFLLLDRNRVLQYVAENEIPQSRFVNTILSFMDKLGLIYFDEHVDFLFDIVDSVYADIERKKISKNSVVLEDSGEDVIVRFGRRLDDTELSVLYEELTTVYFTTDKYGDLREHKLRVINFDKLNSCYRVPYFAVDKVLKVCSKLRISRVVDEVGWVTEEIPQPEFNLTLYPFQEEAVSAWLDNDCKGVVVVPTGGGKTVIALAALQLIHVPTLICVPTIELARQWKEAIKRVLGINTGILGGGSKEIMPVTVAIYNSAVKEINAIKDKFDFVIFDECHHVPAKTFKEVAFNIKARKRLGLSATPQRTDRNEALIYFSVGPVVYTAKYKELVKIGLASPLEFYTVYVDLSDNEIERYSEAEVDNKIQEMMKVALMAKAKYGVLKQILQKHSGSKTLVFTQYLEQARKAYEVAREVTKAALITGETPAKERERAFRLFKEGKITTLVSTTVLDEGVDVPDAEVAIILSGSSTERQLIQRIGRVIRYHPNKVAKVYEVVAAATIETRHAENRRAVLKDYRIEHKLIFF